MKEDFGYASLIELANELSEKVQQVAYQADDLESEGMNSYVISQRNSLERIRVVFDNAVNALVETSQEVFARADERATADLLACFSKKESH